MSTAPAIEERVTQLEKALAELTAGATRNVNRIDTETVPGLRAQIDKLARRVTELERQVKDLQGGGKNKSGVRP